MIYRYIYKITCLTGSWEGKFSFGQHTTDNLNDGYFSSSILICNYKKKYGLENCKREIISFHNTQEELNQAEYDVIHPWLENEMCLNLCEGGKGGPMFKGHQHSEESKKKTTASLYRYYETHEGPNKGKKMWDEKQRKEISIRSKEHFDVEKMTKCSHTDEANNKRRKSMTGKKMPPRTPQWYKNQEYNRIKTGERAKRSRWMTKENEKPIYIDIDKVDYYLSIGYHYGRK